MDAKPLTVGDESEIAKNSFLPKAQQARQHVRTVICMT